MKLAVGSRSSVQTQYQRPLCIHYVRLTDGSVLLDQSMLTGESVPIEAGAGFETYAGALVRRGEAVAEVTATGAHTKLGRTAELVRTAHVESSQQKAILRVVRNLAMINGAIIVILVGYAYALKIRPRFWLTAPPRGVRGFCAEPADP
jgi:cation transport ATPase